MRRSLKAFSSSFWGSDYIPLVEKRSNRFRVVLSFYRIAWFTVSLPFFSFLFCILWSIMYNFEQATDTHCKVYNMLPSVSAAIGHYQPQKNVWRAAIASQALIRILVLYMYYRHYRENTFKWARNITNITIFTYIVENISLVTLSFWSSNENYAFHKTSFTAFLIMSFMHMFMSFIVAKYCRNTSMEAIDHFSVSWKLRTMMLNTFAIFLACYFFYRHNMYCEPLVYSMFALSEYIVVVTNMAFHVTAAYDFSGKSLMISTNGFKII